MGPGMSEFNSCFDEVYKFVVEKEKRENVDLSDVKNKIKEEKQALDRIADWI